MRNRAFLFLILIISITGVNGDLYAQQFQTLFPYPTAPDTCTTLESRCDYSTTHFWDNFNYAKQLTEADDSLLAKAMNDYLDIMGHANITVALTSVRNLMFKAQSNQQNFMRLLYLSTRFLYMGVKPMADDVYLTFAQSAADASWLKSEVRNSYKEVVRRIRQTPLGQPVYNFEYTDAQGRKRHINDALTPGDSALVLLFFTSDDKNTPLEVTRMSADVNVARLISQGYLKVVEVYGGNDASAYVQREAEANPTWQVVRSKEAFSALDLRLVPSLFLLDSEHRLLYKGLLVDGVKQLVQ